MLSFLMFLFFPVVVSISFLCSVLNDDKIIAVAVFLFLYITMLVWKQLGRKIMQSTELT